MVTLVPYNNGMRLGQGFNSYTHEICVDDAVVIDPTRAENVLTNDGTTMRMLVQKINKASIWRQMKEYVVDGQETEISTEPTNLVDKVFEDEEEQEKEDDDKNQNVSVVQSAQTKDPDSMNSIDKHEKEEKEIDEELTKQRTAQKEPDYTESDAKLSEEDRKKAKEKREKAKQEAEAERSVELRQKRYALDSHKPTEQILKEQKESLEKRANELHVSDGIGKNLSVPETWTIQNARGTSQTVSYVSHFVDKVSEINNDMRLSAALSIKFGKFGGSGRGSFVNSEEFNESDLRFYISVKVTNQSINFKDALQYNPIQTISPKDSKEFTKVFGDSFISGFVEGGEFNALVLMKIKNEAKLQDIKAEVKVAFTTPDKNEEKDEKKGDDKKDEAKKDDGKKEGDKDKKGINIDAEGNLKLAKRNIAMNTETTIYVSYSGGAMIKNYDEKWTIDSLIAAAQRFPALVAKYPQRIYAQVTEYRHLRSFVQLKQAKLLPITYKNAQMYTSSLLDVFMEYKSLFEKMTKDIRDVQSGVKVFKEVLKVETIGSDGKTQLEPKETEFDSSLTLRKVTLSNSLINAGLTKVFSSTLEGLGKARQSIRLQMNAIVSEVDAITENPALSMSEEESKWAGAASFRTLIPKIEYKVRKVRGTPLSSKPISSEPKVEGQGFSEDSFVFHLFDEANSPLPISQMEQVELSEIEQSSPSLADKTRVTAPVGSTTAGTSFSGLDHNLSEPVINQVIVWLKDGLFCCMSVVYDIGLTVDYGGHIEDYKAIADDNSIFEMKSLIDLGLSEMITSVSIEVEGGVAVEYMQNHRCDTTETKHTHSSAEIYDDQRDKLRVIGIALSTNRGKMIQALSKRDSNEYSDLHKIHQFEKPLKETYVSGFWGRQSDKGIHRLGLIWTQAPPRERLFDEEVTMDCISGSVERQGPVLFERTLLDKPNVIWGLRSFGWNLEKESVDNKQISLRMNTKMSEPTTAGFLYEDPTQYQFPKITEWMVVPELNDVFIQSGEVEIFGDQSDNGSYQEDRTIEFNIPFIDQANVKAICWLINFDIDSEQSTGENGESFHLKTDIVGEIKTKMMSIRVGDGMAFAEEIKKPMDEAPAVKKESGPTETKKASDETVKKPEAEANDKPVVAKESKRSKFWRAKIGWLAYEYSGSANAGHQFGKGKISSLFKRKETRITWEEPWESNPSFKFLTEPSQTFIAISEVTGQRRFSPSQDPKDQKYSITLKDATKDRITLTAEAPSNSTLGAVWISCL